MLCGHAKLCRTVDSEQLTSAFCVGGNGRHLRKRKKVDYFPEADAGEKGDLGGSSSVTEEADPEEEGSDGEGSDGSDDTASSASPQAKRRRGRSASARAPQQRRPPPNWVECPCCTQHFPMAFFNDHLDK